MTTSDSSLCPLPQFEAFTQATRSLASLALASRGEKIIPNGTCAGAKWWSQALGQRTSILDFWDVPPGCSGKDLFAALTVATVDVPAEYLGLERGGAVTFRAMLPGNERWERETLHGLEFAREGCGELSSPSSSSSSSSSSPYGTLFYAPVDFGNLNLWHSLAALHSIWTAAQQLSQAGRPLIGFEEMKNNSRSLPELDITSNHCACNGVQRRNGFAGADNQCNCSLASALSSALALPTANTNATNSTGMLRAVAKVDRTRCYARHVFVFRHRTDVIDDSTKTNEDERKGTSRISGFGGGVSGKECGLHAPVVWRAATGLLWDAKFCRDRFNCRAPPNFRHFVADLWWAAEQTHRLSLGKVARRRKEEQYSTRNNKDNKNNNRKTRQRKRSTRAPLNLCYMSRGLGRQRGGMADEAAMRAFVENGTATTCGGSAVLDFGHSPSFFGNFSAQAVEVVRVARCGVLMGPHGAGMGHLLWLMVSQGEGGGGGGGGEEKVSRSLHRPAVVELLGGNTQPYYYMNLARLAGLRYLRWGTGGRRDLVEEDKFENEENPEKDSWTMRQLFESEESEDSGDETPNPDFVLLARVLNALCEGRDIEV